MADTDTIFIISPGYIDAIVSCLSNYKNFCIAGYSRIDQGLEALRHIPGRDILGFSYFHDNIRGEDVNELRAFVNKINIMYEGVVDPKDETTKIPFLFLLSTQLGGNTASSEYLRSILKEINVSNLAIGYYNFGIVTDSVIKLQLFGTILLKRRPFEVARIEIADTFNNTKQLRVDLPFAEKFISIYDPLTFIEVDDYIKRFADDKILCLIRSYLYNNSSSLYEEISSRMQVLSYEERIPYDIVLRNLNLISR